MYLLITFGLIILFAQLSMQVKAEEVQQKGNGFEPASVFRQMRSNFESVLNNKENPLSRFFGAQHFKSFAGGPKVEAALAESQKNNYATLESSIPVKEVKGSVTPVKVSRSTERHARPTEEEEEVSAGVFTKGNSEKVIKILSNPTELLDLIAKHFNLDAEKLKAQVGKSVTLGTETLISPALVGVQIIEKVFVPDKCRLKLMCNLGRYVTGMRNDSIFRFQPKHTESSHYMRAFTQGFHGNDCEGAFPQCEPKLQKPYEDFIASARQTFASRGNKSSKGVTK